MVTAAPVPTDAPPDYAAALARIGHRYRSTGVLSIAGVDRVAFLQGQLTQDVRNLQTGQSLPAAGLSPKGKLLYFGRILATPERLLLLVPTAVTELVRAHLTKYAAFQKVTLADVSEEFLLAGLYGPGAAQIEPPEGTIRLAADGELASGIFAPAGGHEELDRLLATAGSVPVSEATAEILRIEAGRPRLGCDADESNLPDEVHLQAAISTTKGCYVGQEVVARLRTYGRLNRRLVGFRFSERPLAPGTIFPAPDKPGLEHGRVTSSAWSPRFGAIGLGFAFREVPEGAALAVPGQPDLTAVVAPLPFA